MRTQVKLLQGILLWMLIPSTADAQWNSGSQNAIYYNTGNVGIGISNPQTKLHILTSANGGLKISGNTSSY